MVTRGEYELLTEEGMALYWWTGLYLSLLISVLCSKGRTISGPLWFEMTQPPLHLRGTKTSLIAWSLLTFPGSQTRGDLTFGQVDQRRPIYFLA